MGDRAGRATRRAARLENQANMGVDIGRDVDGGDSVFIPILRQGRFTGVTPQTQSVSLCYFPDATLSIYSGWSFKAYQDHV